MNSITLKISHFIHETQLYFAILLGMTIQYLFSATKTAKGVLLIIIVTVFSAWFIIPMMIDILNLLFQIASVKFQIEHDGRIAIGLYATSSLVSVELIAIIINLLPSMLRDTVKKHIDEYLGGDVKDGNNDAE